MMDEKKLLVRAMIYEQQISLAIEKNMEIIQNAFESLFNLDPERALDIVVQLNEQCNPEVVEQIMQDRASYEERMLGKIS